MSVVKKIMIQFGDQEEDIVLPKVLVSRDCEDSYFDSKKLCRSLLTDLHPPDSKLYNFTSPEAVSRYQGQKDRYDTKQSNFSRVFRKETAPDVSDYAVPYAITFTIPSGYKVDINNCKKVSMRNYVEIHKLSNVVQGRFMRNKIEDWLHKFTRSQKACNDYFRVISFEMYHELTQAGVIHTHALLYCNNNYIKATANMMADLWVKINPGRKADGFTGVQKISMKRGKDRAFDGCNNVKSWRKYITKESPQYADNPAYDKRHSKHEISCDFV